MRDGSRERWIRGSLRTAFLVAIVVVGLLVAYRELTSIRLVPADEAVPAPELALVDLDGRPASLSAFRGEVVLLNVWAGWCPPCRAEVPRLNRLQRALGEQGLVVLGVNVEPGDASSVRATAERLGIEYRVLRPRGPLPAGLGWDGSLPTVWLIDRRGRLRGRHVGRVGESALRGSASGLLAEGR